MASTPRPRDVRMVSRCRVEFERPEGSTVGETEDVSARGAFVRTDALLPAGKTTTVRLTLPTGEMLVFVARVAHTLSPAAATAMGRHPGMGISFIEGRSPSLVMLRAYLSTLRIERTSAALPERVGVVLVEPDDPLRARLAQSLAGAGFEVRGYGTAADGLAACTEQHPSLVVLAVDMPGGMSGLDLAYALADHEALSSVPVLMNGEDAGPQDRLEMFQAGVRDFVPRPFLEEELVIRSRRLLQGPGAAFEMNTPVPVSPAVVAVAQAANQSEVSLRGKLTDVGLGTLLSLFEFERKSGVLRVQRGADVGTIHFGEGRMRRIDGGPAATPRARLLALLDWVDATFEFQAGPVTGSDDVGVSVQAVLLEHARWMDERAAGRPGSRTGQRPAGHVDARERPATDLEWADVMNQRPDTDVG